MSNQDKSYKRAMRHPLGEDQIWCANGVAAEVIAEHFAVRPVYEPHESGVDGLYMETAEVDHIPSGYRAGPPDTLTLAQAVTYAASLATAPADWEREKPNTNLPGLPEFSRACQSAAIEGRKIEYAPWLAEQKRLNSKEPAGEP